MCSHCKDKNDTSLIICDSIKKDGLYNETGPKYHIDPHEPRLENAYVKTLRKDKTFNI